MPASTQSNETKSLTVRLKPDLYREATRVAERQGRSLNTLVQQGLEAILRIEEEREMERAAEILSLDADETDVLYAFAAQAEVVLRDEH